MSSEDQRAAANISVILSGQLMAAALAMLAVEGAVLSFVYSYRITGYFFFTFIVLAAIFFICSIGVAGKGITDLRDKGYEGNWEPKLTKNHFDRQAKLCILGLSCFFLSAFFIGQPKEVELKGDIMLLKQEIQELKNEIEITKKNISALSDRSMNDRKQKKYPKKSLQRMR